MTALQDADARNIDKVTAAGRRLAGNFELPISSFFFLRHGRTSANHQGIIQGHKDVPLDEVGRAQALQAAEWLLAAGLRPRRIISSDLSRAAETARILARRLSMKVTDYDPELRERRFGLIQGIKASQLVWEEDPPGAESVEDFVRRCALALERHLTEPDTLIVAHGGVLRALAALLEQPLSAAERANATPLFVKREDKLWRIRIIPEPEALT